MRFFLLLIILTTSHSLFGQVIITEDKSVSKAMEIYEEVSNQNEYVEGWRIQIINTDDRREMEAAESKFFQMYPDKETEWKHVQPYYQVIVGHYHSKLELEPFLRELKEEFPRAIAIRSKIDKLAFFE